MLLQLDEEITVAHILHVSSVHLDVNGINGWTMLPVACVFVVHYAVGSKCTSSAICEVCARDAA